MTPVLFLTMGRAAALAVRKWVVAPVTIGRASLRAASQGATSSRAAAACPSCSELLRAGHALLVAAATIDHS